ncbi:MAG: hypothetical protein LBT38_06960 [Deltaproteobacteria bacterium]|jgi:hypothetical protein|nr:hypothetical protein [Deltaproteobacteria bacterium]
MDKIKNNISTFDKTDYSIDFGDIYVVNESIKSSGLASLFNNCYLNNKDTLFSLILFRLLSKSANFFAAKWWETSFAKYLFPTAELTIPQINNFLVDLGDKTVFNNFLPNYFNYLQTDLGLSHVLFDISRLHNEVNMTFIPSYSQYRSFYHKINLLLVNKIDCSYPLYYKYIPEHMLDISSIKDTLDEISNYNININKIIVGSDYCSENNIYPINDKNINFITKLSPKNDIFSELLEKYVPSLESLENFIKFGHKNLFVKKININLFNRDINAFICLDVKKRDIEKQKFLNHVDRYMTKDYFNYALPYFGVFILASSYDIYPTEILQLYYYQYENELIFDFLKTDSDILSARYTAPAVFKGYLFLCFLCSIVQSYLSESLKKINYTYMNALFDLNKYHCRVYSNRLVPDVTSKEIRTIADCLSVQIPNLIDL